MSKNRTFKLTPLAAIIALHATSLAAAPIPDGTTTNTSSQQAGETISVADGDTVAVNGAAAITVDDAMVTVDNDGSLSSDQTAIDIVDGGNNATINNGINNPGASISGAVNGINFAESTSNGRVDNRGTISSDSRAINIDGTGHLISNSGTILGTGNQRNGTIYADRSANNYQIDNLADGIIDAGAGNEGAGISLEIGANVDATINNQGSIQGRGQAAASGGTAGDGIRLFGPGLAPSYNFTGSISNSGDIGSESAVGTTSGVRIANRINFQGTVTNSGDISGVNNGLYFGEADHTGGVVNNTGTISSDSRALNIDGTGLVVNNSGSILGTGNQRNGTVYADSTAQGFTLDNSGIIDAGVGNEGAGFSVELSEMGNDFTIDNSGDLLGRGNAGAGAATAGDGIRLERTRVGGLLDGTTTGLFTGTITNSGTISSEGANGTVGGFRAVNGVSFQGTLNNDAGGVISGIQNGVYFGNPTPAGGGDHTGGVINNAGTISSDSRALNIDGSGVVVNNSGSIVGTGDQRNGTVYADSTAQGFTLDNSGIIDAGMGNEGAGFSVELSEMGNDFTIDNSGDLLGRGNAGAGAATAGDGIRLERTRVDGMLDGTTTGLFTGTINNSGTISSEGANGTVGGFRAVNGVSFQGTLNNEVGGVISGVQNGVYFGNPTPAGGGDHTGGVVNNAGSISSDSRALNIDGTGLVVNNSGSIVGTGDQRNGTVYADGTANGFTFNNLASGTVDAGAGNNGDALSIQVGAADNAIQSASISNAGTLQARGATALAGQASGVRLFTSTAGATFQGDIDNSGTIAAEDGAGVLIQTNVTLDGAINNTGTISADSGRAIDISATSSGITINQASGSINGDILLGSGSDIVNISGGSISGSLIGQGLGTVNVGLGNNGLFTSNGITNVADYNILSGTVNQLADFSTASSTTTVGENATLAFSQAVNGAGALVVNGTLSFDAANGETSFLSQDGDVTLANGSALSVALSNDNTAGQQLTLIDASSLVDNGAQLLDNSLLFNLNSSVVSGTLNAQVVTENLAAISNQANASAFGAALTQAVNNGVGGAAGDLLFALNNGDVQGFEQIADALSPSVSGSLARPAREANLASQRLIQARLLGAESYGVGKADQGLWLQGFTTDSDQDNRDSVAGYQSDSDGIAIGYDRQFGDWRLGLAYSDSSADVLDNRPAADRVDIDSNQFSLYGNYRSDNWFASAVVAIADLDYDLSRNSPVAGEGSISATTGGDLFDINLAVGRTYQWGGIDVTPQLGLGYSTLEIDNFVENGGLNLAVAYGDVDEFTSNLGVTFGKQFKQSNWTVSPSLRLAWIHEFQEDRVSANASFNGLSFTQQGFEPEQDRAQVGVGLSLVNESGFSLSLDYNGDFNSGYDSSAGSLLLRYEF